MHLFIQIDQLARSVQWVLCLEEGCYHRPHTLVVLAENGLEDGKVELSHFEGDFIEDVDVFSLGRILGHVEEGH